MNGEDTIGQLSADQEALLIDLNDQIGDFVKEDQPNHHIAQGGADGILLQIHGPDGGDDKEERVQETKDKDVSVSYGE